jgi:hypothetical protein
MQLVNAECLLGLRERALIVFQRLLWLGQSFSQTGVWFVCLLVCLFVSLFVMSAARPVELMGKRWHAL